ncbi:MAG TPA: NAD(+) kinase [Gammaproteobacteria bacterium]|jgi:NAD+ kinase
MTTRFATIGLMGRLADPQVLEMVMRLAAELGRAQVTVYADEALPLPVSTGVQLLPAKLLAEKADLLIVVGGDGTLLKAAHVIAARPIPLVGVNLGRLGFLADITPEQVQDDIRAMLKGEFSTEERLLLEAAATRGGKAEATVPALNDVVVHKSDGGRLIEFETWVDGNFLCAYRADGIVVATPTGSTAYALSGGGPIIHPAMDAMALVPICPHTLGDRPLVVAGKSRIEIRIGDTHGGGAQVTWDGQHAESLQSGDRVEVHSSAKRISFIHPRGYDYYKILRTKLHWGRGSHTS